MRYIDLKRQYERRRPGVPYKVYKVHSSIWLEPDGSFLIQLRKFAWKSMNVNGRTKYKREENGFVPFARMTPDSHLTLLYEIGLNDTSSKLLFADLAGFGSVYSDVTKYKAFEHKLRFWSGNCRYSYNANTTAIDVPCIPGLVIDTINAKVVSSTVDVKTKTNRKKARPAYEHTRNVLKMMDVLYRMGDLTLDRSAYTYPERLAALDETEMGMTEELMAEQARVAFVYALQRVQLRSPVYWKWMKDKNGNQQCLQMSHDENQIKTLNYAALRKYAGNALRGTFKKKHNLLDKEVIDRAK